MKMMALIADTLREIYAKKVIIGVAVIQLIALGLTTLVIVLGGVSKIQTEADLQQGPAGAPRGQHEERPHDLPGTKDTSVLGSDTPGIDSASSDSGRSSTTFDAPIDSNLIGNVEERSTEEQVTAVLGAYGAATGALIGLIGLFIMAGIVPSMMEKGTIDLLLSKPLSRTSLLLGRAVGGFIAIALNVLLFLGAVWLLFGATTGVWHFPFVLYTAAISLFSLLVVYSGVLAMSIFTESWILPLIVAYLHAGFLSLFFLTNRETALYSFIESQAARTAIDGLYYALPQTGDLLNAISEVVYQGFIPSGAPFIQGAIFTVVMFALAIWKFNRKEF